MRLEKPEIVEKYRCPSCMTLYDSSYSAENCCESEPVYLCSICGESDGAFDTETEVKAHLELPHDRIGVVDEDGVTEAVYEELLLDGIAPLTAHELAEKKAAELVPV